MFLLLIFLLLLLLFDLLLLPRLQVAFLLGFSFTTSTVRTVLDLYVLTVQLLVHHARDVFQVLVYCSLGVYTGVLGTGLFLGLDPDRLFPLNAYLLACFGFVKLHRRVTNRIDSFWTSPPGLTILDHKFLPLPLVVRIAHFVKFLQKFLSFFEEVIRPLGFEQRQIFLRVALDQHIRQLPVIEKVNFAFFEVKTLEIARFAAPDKSLIDSYGMVIDKAVSHVFSNHTLFPAQLDDSEEEKLV
jgi:hypothetical protein